MEPRLRPAAPGATATLTAFAWLSIAAAFATIGLKGAAWWSTGSVGLLSDAIESFVNLAAAVATLTMLIVAVRPPDEEHAYGYSKAEYFASGFEGALIVVAAIGISVAAVQRLLVPAPLEQLGLGLLVSGAASAINLAVGVMLVRAGERHGSIALEADGRHLLTDVWTSAGVIMGLLAVMATGWAWLDPLIALGMAVNIVWTGYRLLERSARGLLDQALPPAQRDLIGGVLRAYEARGLQFHALRTRRAAGRSFISVHVLVPGQWSVQAGHELLERIERELRTAVPGSSVLTHLEPIEDPASHLDRDL